MVQISAYWEETVECKETPRMSDLEKSREEETTGARAHSRKFRIKDYKWILHAEKNGSQKLRSDFLFFFKIRFFKAWLKAKDFEQYKVRAIKDLCEEV